MKRSWMTFQENMLNRIIIRLKKNFHMKFQIIDNSLEPKWNFNKKIEKYYSELSNNQIPSDLLNELVGRITDTQYETYERFWIKYPKSRKRYSELRIVDLEHSFTHYEIMDFLKQKDFENYKKYSMILLKMSENDFCDYEKRKYQYETK